MATRKEIMAMTDREEAFQAIEELGNQEGWSSHKKAGARAQWKTKHEPETINRRNGGQAPRANPTRVNINMTVEEFQQAQLEHRATLQRRREQIVNQIQRLREELRRIDEAIPEAHQINDERVMNLPEGEVMDGDLPIAEPL